MSPEVCAGAGLRLAALSMPARISAAISMGHWSQRIAQSSERSHKSDIDRCKSLTVQSWRADMVRLTRLGLNASVALIGMMLTSAGGFVQRNSGGCCHAVRCSPISSSELKKGTGESYTVTATGEAFLPPCRPWPNHFSSWQAVPMVRGWRVSPLRHKPLHPVPPGAASRSVGWRVTAAGRRGSAGRARLRV